jgi:hypothetical protein
MQTQEKKDEDQQIAIVIEQLFEYFKLNQVPPMIAICAVINLVVKFCKMIELEDREFDNILKQMKKSYGKNK